MAWGSAIVRHAGNARTRDVIYGRPARAANARLKSCQAQNAPARIFLAGTCMRRRVRWTVGEVSASGEPGPISVLVFVVIRLAIHRSHGNDLHPQGGIDAIQSRDVGGAGRYSRNRFDVYGKLRDSGINRL
jgi:hypothetical protein